MSRACEIDAVNTMAIVNKSTGKITNAQWLRDHAGHGSDECLTWPFSRVRNGYGNFGLNGKMLYAHRCMCELVNGPDPSPKHHASHKCGRGRQGCVNPRHLEWKTPSENHLDRRLHGTAVTSTSGPRGKLGHDDVSSIRMLGGTITNMRLAERFGVSVDTIRRVRTGETYGRFPWVMGHQP